MKNLLLQNALTILAIIALLGPTESSANQEIVGNVEGKAVKSIFSKKGTFVIYIEKEPESLDPLVSTTKYSDSVIQFMCDSLLRKNIDSYEWTPALASKYEISKDKKSFTFSLRPTLTFHDGKPVTTADVKFSIDKLMERTRKFAIPQLEDFFATFQKSEVVDPQTIIFYFSNANFKNFEILATFPIVSKAYYQNRKVAAFKEEAGRCAGPYRPIGHGKDHKLYLEYYSNWYGSGDPLFKDQFNFANIIFKTWNSESEFKRHLKKGEIDFFKIDSPDIFFPNIGDIKKYPKMEKIQVESKLNRSFDFISWNLRNPIFQDRETRIALAHLMNRVEINTKFRKGFSKLAIGPISPRSDFAPEGINPIPYDRNLAIQYLRKAGWSETGKEGLLQKKMGNDRLDFRFTLFFADPDREPYFLAFQKELKSVGIEMNLKLLDWNHFLENIGSENFEAVYLAWSAGYGDPDPYLLWHSKSSSNGGRNFISYKNPSVDDLIERAREEFDRPKRIKIMQKLYQKIIEDAPYLFMFTELNQYYLVNTHIKRNADTANYDIGLQNWKVQ